MRPGGVAAFGCGVRVRAGDEHTRPAGDLGGGVGFTGIQAPPMAFIKAPAATRPFSNATACTRGSCTGRFARAQLERFHRRRNIHHRRAHPQATGLEGDEERRNSGVRRGFRCRGWVTFQF